MPHRRDLGAGQPGVASVIVGAALGIPVEAYVGEVGTKQQALLVFRMELMGARVIPVKSGTRTLKDAINEALREPGGKCPAYLLPDRFCGSARTRIRLWAGLPVSDRERVHRQVMKKEGGLQDTIVACVGGGSNAMGIFYPFVKDDVDLVCVEARGEGVEIGKHSATLCAGEAGVLHDTFSYLLQDDDGQVLPTHSISAGLDCPGVGPEHSMMTDSSRVTHTAIAEGQEPHICHARSRFRHIDSGACEDLCRCGCRRSHWR